MVSNQKKIPYFIKIGGCHNCKVRQAYTTDSGTFYDEGHAFHAKCIHKECDKYGYNIETPFIEPKEYLRVGADLSSRKALNKAKEVLVKFYDFYDSRGDLLPWVLESVAIEKNEKPANGKDVTPLNGYEKVQIIK
jgi:hypothetical protein